MFFSSTRLTLIPQGSVAISSAARILVLIQFQVTDDITQGGGGQILNSHHGILYTVGEQLGICDLVKDYGIDPHGYVILGDYGLGWEIRYLLF